MSLAEAIQILKSVSCPNCPYGCETALSCDISFCDYKQAITIAIELMQKILDGNNIRGELRMSFNEDADYNTRLETWRMNNWEYNPFREE